MNLIKLAIKPNEYFEENQDGETGKREPIKLRYLFIALIVFSVLSFAVQKMVIPELDLGEANLLPIPKEVFTILQYAGCIVFPLITSWIVVNILYLVNKVLISSVENKQIEDKKYFKSLLYFRYIVLSIATMILGAISVLILKNSDSVAMIGAINNLFIKLWATYILFGILKYYVKTEKLHKILPTILYILTIIWTAFIMYMNTLMSSFAV